MRDGSGRFQHMRQQASMVLTLIIDAWHFLIQCLRPAPALAADNLFLRKQLALYEERQVHPSQITNATRLAMVWLSYWFDWGSALRVVTPETFTRWHRAGFRLFWRWKSKPGRPPLPTDFQMALENPTWGQERIANELLLQLGLRVSPRTVRKYIILHEWVAHYNEDRPHMALGPGIPQPSSALPVTPQAPRHQIPTGQRAVARSVLGGLHHD